LPFPGRPWHRGLPSSSLPSPFCACPKLCARREKRNPPPPMFSFSFPPSEVLSSFICRKFIGRQRRWPAMKIGDWLKSEVEFWRDLANSGWQGARTASDSILQDQPVGRILGRSARASWAPTVMGAGVGAEWGLDDEEVTLNVPPEQVGRLALALAAEILKGGKDAVNQLAEICEVNDVPCRIACWRPLLIPSASGSRPTAARCSPRPAMDECNCGAPKRGRRSRCRGRRSSGSSRGARRRGNAASWCGPGGP